MKCPKKMNKIVKRTLLARELFECIEKDFIFLPTFIIYNKYTQKSNQNNFEIEFDSNFPNLC